MQQFVQSSPHIHVNAPLPISVTVKASQLSHLVTFLGLGGSEAGGSCISQSHSRIKGSRLDAIFNLL